MECDEDKILEKASFYKKKDDYKKVVEILREGIECLPNSRSINSLLGLFLVNLKEYDESLKYLNKAMELGNKSEFIHLGLYLVFANTDEDEKAVKLLFNYLKDHEADLFKDTLEELVEGLQNGYMTKYKDEILYFARKNKVIPSA